MSIDVGSLAAIDVHVHAERNEGEEQDPVTGDWYLRVGPNVRYGPLRFFT